MQDHAQGLLSGIPARYAAATEAQALFLLEGEGGLFAAKWRLPRYRVPNLWAPHHAIGYRSSGVSTVTRCAGGVKLRREIAVSSVTFSPGDRPTEWASDAPVEAIHLYISRQALQAYAQQHLKTDSPPELREFFGVHDPWFAGYFQLLESECALGAADSLLLDQTEPLVLRRLLDEYPSAARTSMPGQRPGVTPLRRGVTRRIEEYIDANMDAAVSLSVLAQLARMSVDHFVRAFRAATGKTPHRFVLERRLEHAAGRLRADNASVAEIARGCGFRSAAHFSVKFHARFGVTPSEYRRSA